MVRDVIARVFIFQGFHEGHYFFRDMASSEVFIFDQAGALVNQWNKKGDVPGKFFMTASHVSFEKNGKIMPVELPEMYYNSFNSDSKPLRK